MTECLCFSCGKKMVFSLSVQRRDECEHCGADVKVCLNCQFYDKGSYNECKESSADVVQEKDRANFCDYFVIGKGSTKNYEADTLKMAAEALFKKGSH